jgi:hypothetical protein
MIVSSKIVAPGDEDDPPQMTSAEWALIERYIKNSGLDSWSQWSQSDQVAVTRAFQKAYCYPRVSSDAVAKIRKLTDENRAGA